MTADDEIDTWAQGVAWARMMQPELPTPSMMVFSLVGMNPSNRKRCGGLADDVDPIVMFRKLC